MVYRFLSQIRHTEVIGLLTHGKEQKERKKRHRGTRTRDQKKKLKKREQRGGKQSRAQEKWMRVKMNIKRNKNTPPKEKALTGLSTMECVCLSLAFLTSFVKNTVLSPFR